MKKFKLALSLATMCLAIMVLCFGVYSATNITYNIGGTISYKIDDVMVEVTTRLYKKSDALSQDDLKTKVEAIENVSLDSIAKDTYGEYEELHKFSTLDDLSKTTYEKNGIELNYNNFKTYFIVVNVKSLTSDASYQIAINESIQDLTKINSNYYATELQNEITKPATEENIGKNLIIAYSLKDSTTSIDKDVKFNHSMEISKSKVESTLVALKTSENPDNQSDYGYEVSSRAKFNKSEINIVETLNSNNYLGNYSDNDTILYYDYTWMCGFKIENIVTEDYNCVEYEITQIGDNPIEFKAIVLKKLTYGQGRWGYEYSFNQTYDNKSYTQGIVGTTGVSNDSSTLDLSKGASIHVFFVCENKTIADQINNNNNKQISIKFRLCKSVADESLGLRFNQINGGTELEVASINTSITGENGVLTIPEVYEIDGKELPVTKIKYYGFFHCANLTKVVIPNGVTEIGNNAFNGCNKLTSCNIPNKLKYIGVYCFYGPELSGELIIPNSVTFIGEYAFCGQNIESLTVSGSIAYIGETAFAHCEKLTTVTLGEGIKEIDSCAFSYCTSLTKVVIPEGVETIGISLFYGDTALTEVTIPVSLKTFDLQIFSQCGALTTINYNGTIAQWKASMTDDTSSSTLVYEDGQPREGLTIKCSDGNIMRTDS